MAQKTGSSYLNICWPNVNKQRRGQVPQLAQQHLKTTQSHSNLGIQHKWLPVHPLQQVKASKNVSTCAEKVQLGVQRVGILLTISLREQAGMYGCRSAG